CHAKSGTSVAQTRSTGTNTALASAAKNYTQARTGGTGASQQLASQQLALRQASQAKAAQLSQANLARQQQTMLHQSMAQHAMRQQQTLVAARSVGTRAGPPSFAVASARRR